MQTRWSLAVLSYGLTVALLGGARGQEAPATATPTVPPGWTFTLPDGDAQDGQTVFMRMECYSCHVRQGLPEKPPAGAGGIGPDLSQYGTLPPAYLAESIMKAHTVVAAPGYVVKEGKAGMGNYNHFMTLQELIDLVAFLKQGPEDGTK